VTEIDGKFWGISLALGFVSIPLGCLIRCIPNGPVQRFFYKIRLLRDPNKQQLLPSTRPNAENADDWNPALNLLHDTLTTFSICGAQASSSFVIKTKLCSFGDLLFLVLLPSL
jgi:P-type Ca2+ transporter type 2C